MTLSIDELGCRTQYWTKVANARSMYHNWGADVIKGDKHGVMTMLHRDVFYRDYMDRIKDLGVLMGFKVVEEA